uniref:LLM class F420-dependent oxidoreductase n=1 Tax=Thermosporothrix sp. COM3 TaxID=2490863 RepID=A0A455SH53_9CHLR|nr:LLM class F420-dependent oxidoreductase [Thermosporothrix sp. COM3]
MTVKFGWALSVGPTEGISQQQFHKMIQKQIELADGVVDSLWFVDHLQFGSSAVLEGWTTLTYLAAQYPQFQVGHMVLCQSFRNPALLAKMATTLQYMSNGRFLLSIGAGWHEEEYRAYGYPFPSPRVRVEQLEETLQIVKSLWTHEQTTFQGKHFSVQAAYCEPKPDPIPPIIIGGKGTRLLHLVARYADGWNAPWLTPEDYAARAKVLEQECQKVGRDPSSVQRSWFGRCTCVATEQEACTLHDRGLTGTPDQIAAQLQQYIDLGIDTFMLGCNSFDDMTTAELLLKEVLPRFQ